jgi:hypothetical protein
MKSYPIQSDLSHSRKRNGKERRRSGMKYAKKEAGATGKHNAASRKEEIGTARKRHEKGSQARRTKKEGKGS